MVAEASGMQEDRFRYVESRLAKLESIGAGAASSGNALESLRNGLDALTKRLTRLERSCAKPSVTNDACCADDLNGLDVLTKRLTRLERSCAKSSSANDAYSGDDLANFQKALRGTQKDVEMNTSRIKDLDATVTALRGRLELIWPIVGASLHGSVTSDVTKSTDAASGGSGETPDLLVAPPLEAHFATKEAHEALRRDLQSIGESIGSGMQGMRGNLDDLRQELMNLLRSKANASDFQAYLRQHAFEMRNSMVNDQRHHDEICTESPALTKVPLLPARCISCDRKVDVAAARPNPWQVGGMPGPSPPQRDPACMLHKAAGPPPGYRQRRETSLPPVSKER